MDAPPNVPHGIVQAENQDAIDALLRLAGAREGLARIYDEQPVLARPDAAGARQLLDALPGFWAAPASAGGETRRTLVGNYLANVMRETATLRRLDGTLRGDASSLATRITTADDAPLPAGIHVRELMLGDVAHAGSLIALDDGSPDLALLFTARGGWEAFDSLDRLLETTRRRLLESVSAADGSGMEDDAFAEAKARHAVGSRDIHGFVFDTLARRMIDVQRERIATAADDYALDADAPRAATELADRIHDELLPTAMLDVEAIERLREARLLEAAVANRLAGVPGDVRDAWYAARDTYNDALAATAWIRAGTGIQPPSSLRAFASRELATRLTSLGIDESPETITVNITGAGVLPEALSFIDPLRGAAGSRHLSLVDFASQNIGRFSLDTLHATDAQGQSMRARLGHTAIRDMVRELDLAHRYQAYLDEKLRAGPVGALVRKLTLSVQAAHMRMEAVEARLSYFLPDQPRAFIDDREQRGFRWVEAALDTVAAPRKVAGHDIVVSQLTYRHVALDGILLIASGSPASASRIVMYTPGAPDGLAFREFESRQDAAKKFLYHPAFREYLLDHLPAEFATVSPNGQTRRFAGDHLAHWVLGASKSDAYTLTDEPIGERAVAGDFLAADYDATVEKFRRDARFIARSTASADGDTLLATVQARFNQNPTNVLATVAAEVPSSLSRMMQASWRFYDHVKAGDTGEAVIAFTDGYVNALNLVVPPFVGGRHMAGAIVRSHSTAGGLAIAPVRMAPARIRFESRYAARDLKKAGTPDDQGIFRFRGESFVEQDGMFFFVRHDDDYGRWRLTPARGATDMRFTGPMIERQEGRWVYAQGAGLCGGMRRLCERMNRVVLGDPAPAPAQPGIPPNAPPAPPAAAAAPRPNGVERLLAPHRAEIDAVLNDNPSAAAFLRVDGTHLKFIVPRRHALILDANLQPELAELSAHQRRVFMHELDARFPLRAEHAEVLDARGWAQPGGRRLPSPPGSPGRGGDMQSPSISSTTGDSTPPPPTLSAGQQSRWDEALEVARSTPRSPRRSLIDPAAEPITETLPAAELVPLAEWPERLWYFSERRFESELWPGLATEGVTLGNDPMWLNQAEGLHSYTLSALPPETPVGRLSQVLGTSPTQQAAQRDPLRYALQIDMSRLRDARAWVPGQQAAGLQFDFDLHRRVLPDGEYQYFLRSMRPVRLPHRYVVNTGRRGESPAPLPLARY